MRVNRMWTTKTLHSEVEGRFDADFYHPERVKIIKMIRNSPFTIKKLKDIVMKREEQINPLDYSEDTFDYISLANVRKGGEILKILTVTGTELRSHKNVFYGDDILFPKIRTYLNKIVLVPQKLSGGICSTEFVVLTPRDVNNSFLWSVLTSNLVLKQSSHIQTGSTRPRASRKDMGNLRIPVPPKEIQNRIAEIIQNAYGERKNKLDKAEGLLNAINSVVLEELGIKLPESREWKTFQISHTELNGRLDVFYYNPKYTKVLNKLEKTRASRELKTIDELGKVKCGPFGSSIQTKDYKEDGVPLIRIGNLKDGTVVETEETPLVFISKGLSEKLGSTQVFPDDIVVSQRGTIGNISKVPNTYKVWNISANLIAIKEPETVNPDYVWIFLNSPYGQLQLKKFSSGHVQAKITTDDVKSIKILIPPKEVQNTITKRVKRIYDEARGLRTEAEEVVKNAKQKVEQMILRGNLD